MHKQISFLPSHKIRTFGEGVDGALFDDTNVFPEGFVVTDKVYLQPLVNSTFEMDADEFLLRLLALFRAKSYA